jgi:TonB family protein
MNKRYYDSQIFATPKDFNEISLAFNSLGIDNTYLRNVILLYSDVEEQIPVNTFIVNVLYRTPIQGSRRNAQQRPVASPSIGNTAPESAKVSTSNRALFQRALFQSTTQGEEHTLSLSRRSVMGDFPKPAYNSQSEGKVVVEITINRDGTVTTARAIEKDSTIQDYVFWEASEDAALKTRFNAERSVPEPQAGKITYVFSLK